MSGSHTSWTASPHLLLPLATRGMPHSPTGRGRTRQGWLSRTRWPRLAARAAPAGAGLGLQGGVGVAAGCGAERGHAGGSRVRRRRGRVRMERRLEVVSGWSRRRLELASGWLRRRLELTSGWTRRGPRRRRWDGPRPACCRGGPTLSLARVHGAAGKGRGPRRCRDGA